ncbi:MAG TPA: hypothetical protein P5136_01380 [Methanofastidiosum sp.]|nr:hypothetical protein [Methanofastidiosum sp.]
MTPMPKFKKEDGKDWIKVYEENHRYLEELDEKARLEGKLEGRFVTHPFADSQAIYFIIKENKKTVTIQVCEGLGDDWVLPAWGPKTNIPKEYALKNVGARDYWKKLIEERKEGKQK